MLATCKEEAREERGNKKAVRAVRKEQEPGKAHRTLDHSRQRIFFFAF